MDDAQLQALAKKISQGDATRTDVADFTKEISSQLEDVKSLLTNTEGN